MITAGERIASQIEIWHKMLENFGANLRCAAPGIMETFDSTKQTATVRLAISENVVINGIEETVEIPILVDVPIQMPRAGGFSALLPIKQGDECLVVFGDSNIDAWFTYGDVNAPMNARRHSLSDGFAIMGVWSQPNKLSSYPTDAAQIRTDDGTTMVEVKDGTVNVKAGEVNLSDSATLYRLIDERFAVLFDGHTHICSVDSSTHVGVTAVPNVLLTPSLSNNATTKTKAN